MKFTDNQNMRYGSVKVRCVKVNAWVFLSLTREKNKEVPRNKLSGRNVGKPP